MDSNNRIWILGLITGIVVSASLIFYGCQTGQIKPAPDPAPAISNVQKELKASSTQLSQTTADIKTQATNGEQKTPTIDKPILDPFWFAILGDAGQQSQIVKDLADKDAQINVVQSQLSQLKTHDQEESSRADKAETDLNSAIHKDAQLMIVFGGLGIAGSVALFVLGIIYNLGNIAGKISIGLGIFSAAIIGAGVVITETQPLIPYFVVAIILTLIGLCIYFIIKYKSQIESAISTIGTQSSAVSELVQTAEAGKQLMTTQARNALYGSGAIPGIAHTIQSGVTQAIVAAHKTTVTNAPSVPVQAATDQPAVMQPQTPAAVAAVVAVPVSAPNAAVSIAPTIAPFDISSSSSSGT